MTLEQLKAKAYDLLLERQNIEIELQKVNGEIQNQTLKEPMDKQLK